MKLDAILTKTLGARKDGAAYLIPQDVEATLFVALPGETLVVTRINRIELGDGMVFAETSRGEHFAVQAEDVRAIKVDRVESGSGRRERAAGFGK